MRNFVAFLAIALAVFSGIAVFYIRYQVGEEIDAINKISRQMAKDRRAIHVLKTEFAYLTSPAQLQELSVNYLAMMPPKASQVLVSLDKIPLRKDESQRIYAFKDSPAPQLAAADKDQQERVGR